MCDKCILLLILNLQRNVFTESNENSWQKPSLHIHQVHELQGRVGS